MKDFFKFTFATVLGILIATSLGISILFGIAGALAGASEVPTTVQPKSIYKLELEGNLIDRSEDDPFSGLLAEAMGQPQDQTLGLDDVLANIEKAKNDSNIVGIYLKCGSFYGGTASIKTIRDALLDFRKSKKFVVAYGDNYSQRMYYLASAANKVLVNPQGMVEFKGLSAETMFFKNTLEKLGIEIQVIRVGTFKSAVEPFTSTQMSDSNRLQVKQFIGSIWNNTLKQISASRNIKIDSLNAYADRMLMFAPVEKAKEYSLVDSIVYADEVEAILKKLANIGTDTDLELVSHNSLKKLPSTAKTDDKKIAVIYAVGSIDVDEEGIQSEQLIETINEVAKDDAIKAVVLRVNSPGGSAYGSEQIWRAISLLKKKKPVVVSMGDYAASGGYYISSMADRILAEPNTITGSIGIFGLIPNIQGFNEKIGVSYDGVTTNKMSDFVSVNRPFRPEERNIMQAYVDRGYELFVKRCAEGRKRSVAQIKAIAEGRVWTGEDALKIGLVDEIGGLKDAIRIAAKKAKLSSYEVNDYPVKEDFAAKLMKDFGKDIESRVTKIQLGEHYELFKQIKNLGKVNGIQARMPYDIVIK